MIRHDDVRAVALIDAALETGQTLIFPTDTIYGIGGNPWDERTLARVRSLKKRPSGQPFTLHLPTIEAIGRFAAIRSDLVWAAIEALLPGPFTLLLNAASGAPASAVRDGRVGVRVPDHPLFRDGIRRIDRPLFGTSVNEHGEPPMSNIDEIIERFSSVDLIVTGDVGRSASTIVDLSVSPPRIVRGESTGRLEQALEPLR